MMTRKKTYLLLTVLALAGCGTVKQSAYDEMVSFIVCGYRCGWDSIRPDDRGLSPVYEHLSQYAGYDIRDINDDGVKELLIGDQFEDGSYFLYDIFTTAPSDGALIHLARGGERDTYSVNGSGILVESASNSAFDSFVKGWKIKDGMLDEVDSWETDTMPLSLKKFSEMDATEEETATVGNQKGLVGAFGSQREITEDEMAMFRGLIDGEGEVRYAPLSVSTQVVAGTNYRFYCRFQDLSDNIEHDSDKYGYCWITIYKPLPGRGEPEVSSIEKIIPASQYGKDL